MAAKYFVNPFLILLKQSLKDGSLSKVFPKRIRLPERDFPPSFIVKKENFFCGGYFVCYNQQIAIEDVVKACQTSRWKYLANLIADFLIIYADYSSKEIFLLTGQLGGFPCYFSITDEKLILSTDFGIVKDNLFSLTLNQGSVFDYLYFNYVTTLTDETIIAEITQVPPATLLRIDRNFSFTLTPLIDLERFLGLSQESYKSLAKFTDDLVVNLEKITSEYLQTLGQLDFGADLSSGFDSSLVCYVLKKVSKKNFPCYSLVSRLSLGDTNPEVVQEFARRHKLKLNFLNAGPFYPFAQNHDLNWTTNHFYPGDHGQELRFRLFSLGKKDKIKAIFHGYGGDELYTAFLMDESRRFATQKEYFYAVMGLKWGIDKIFTKEGIEILLDRKRFAKKKFYPSIIAPSAIAERFYYFPIHWETGIWGVSPMSDLRLIQFARRIPHRGRKVPSKQEIWQHRKDIFVPSQFVEKGDYQRQIGQFLTKKKDWVIPTLENSVLAQRGWIKAEEIIDDVRQGNVETYLKEPLILLHNVLRLEYFLQHNKVKT